jgi:hypothetical protein
MDWTSLIGPAVVAAVIASVVSVIGFVINRTTVRGMHSERLAFDREQAERRATAEIALIERKLTADIVLAEKKLAIDQALVTWRRRHELAEQVLATVYEARDALAWARAPVGFSGDGDTREGTESESDKLRERRNSYFVPVERLSHDKGIFSKLQTLRYPIAAHFTPEAAKSLAAIIEVYMEIGNAADILIGMACDDDDRLDRQSFTPFLEVLGRSARPDANDKKIADAVNEIETVCKPVLSERGPA